MARNINSELTQMKRHSEILRNLADDLDLSAGEKRPTTPTPANRERTDDEMEAGEALLLLYRDYVERHGEQKQHRNPHRQAQGKNHGQTMNGDQRPRQNKSVAQTGGRPQASQFIPQQNPDAGTAAMPVYPIRNANGLPYMHPGARHTPVALTGQEALQAYLIRQQILAGVAPENLIMMRGPQQHRQQLPAPPLLQITNQGVFAPAIPPAAFNGVFHPYPVMAFQPNAPGAPGLAGVTGPQVRFAVPSAPIQGVAAQNASVQYVAGGGSAPVHQCGFSHNRSMMPQAIAQTRLRLLQNGNPPAAAGIAELSTNLPSQNRATVPAGTWANGVQALVTSQTPTRRLIEGNANVPGTEQKQKAGLTRAKIPGSRFQPRETLRIKAESSAATDATTKQANLTGIRRAAIGQNSKRRRVPQSKPAPQPGNERLRLSSSSGSDIRPVSLNSADADRSLMSNVQQKRNRGKSGDRHHFSILKSLVGHPASAFMIIDCLEVQDVINLHLTFKRFFYLVQNNLAIIIMRKAAQNAFEAMRIFPFACYYKLCDEALAPPGLRLDNGKYLVPSFRWLQMILYRDMVINDIMNLMIDLGWDLPEPCELVLKKLWFLMDIPDNRRRLWTIQNRSLWPDTDLFLAAYFISQLDLLFMSHHAKKKNGCMRRLLMAQPGLTLLWEVLKGTALNTHYETLKAYVRWQFKPEECQTGQWLFGVPPNEIGSLQWEGYGRKARTVKFKRPDHLILKEIENRKLGVQSMYVDIILCEKIEPSHETCTWPDEIMKEAGNSPWLQTVTLQW
ncbi:uncharacterized protein ACLA_002000 [Aspergillus clavatus NRRL 1]|uniref:Uncharacterized protein n=1 Tax=Aspergillus clavatus (strain ATCC 1007 / CBS 513.65 / DSM 816 / NCTC 3887 / NRRL 1 / QM 1276 / 107) TaxID=344612 RepID=A1C521_ASPCL|nr:uncharacterized protein ACLA_002000 [Aspergillus clavatus NRRL 1]EAW14789.1 conserved hypothetical protein [Aspergillus clavatus NRRL 1]